MTSLEQIAKIVDTVCPKRFLVESIYYEYSVPQDPEKRFYDFYTLSLYNDLLGNKNILTSGLLKPGWDEDTISDLKSIVQDGFKEILGYMYKDVLDASVTAVVSELRHALERSHDGMGKEESQKIFDNIEPEETRNKFKKFLDVHYEFVDHSMDDNDYAYGGGGGGDDDEESMQSYENSKIAFKKSKMSIPEVIDVGQTLFPLKIWYQDYGGMSWFNITSALERLYKAKSDSDKVLALDHILDLEHNTGSIFTKSRRYSKASHSKDERPSFVWIKKALDFKYQASPWALASKSTIPASVIGRLNRLTGADSNFDQTGSLAVMIQNEFKNNIKKMFSANTNIAKTQVADLSFMIDRSGKVLLASPSKPSAENQHRTNSVYSFMLQRVNWDKKVDAQELIKATNDTLALNGVATLVSEGKYTFYINTVPNMTKAQKEKIVEVFQKVASFKGIRDPLVKIFDLKSGESINQRYINGGITLKDLLE